jgi:hypothetical protein
MDMPLSEILCTGDVIIKTFDNQQPKFCVECVSNVST